MLNIEAERLVRLTDVLRPNNEYWFSDFVSKCIIEKLGEGEKSIREQKIISLNEQVKNLLDKIRFESFKLKEIDKEEQDKRDKKTIREADKIFSINQTEKQKQRK